MTRLFVRGALLILGALVLSFVGMYVLTHRRMLHKWEQHPPEFAVLIRTFADASTAHMSPRELTEAIAGFREEAKLPFALFPMDDERIASDVREQLRRGDTTVRKERRLTAAGDAVKGLVVYVPSVDPQRVLVVGPLRPTPPEWDDWLMTLLLVTIIVTVTAVMISLPLVKKLRVLEDSAKRIAAGDLDARATVRSRDAVGDLATTFNDMVARIQQLLENQRHLVQAVSHELRTPIARIRFGLEMMAATTDAAVAGERRKALESDLSELDQMVEELLLYSRYDSGRARLSKVTVEPVLMIQEQLDRFAALYPELKMAIVSALPTDERVILDVSSVERVIRNLVANAARYAIRRVEVHVGLTEAALVLEVHDDGPGIPEKDRGRILEPFVRIDDSRTRSSGGVGLGLSIVDRILRTNGGTVGIGQSSLGGTRVTTSWPLADGSLLSQ